MLSLLLSALIIFKEENFFSVLRRFVISNVFRMSTRKRFQVPVTWKHLDGLHRGLEYDWNQSRGRYIVKNVVDGAHFVEVQQGDALISINGQNINKDKYDLNTDVYILILKLARNTTVPMTFTFERGRRYIK